MVRQPMMDRPGRRQRRGCRTPTGGRPPAPEPGRRDTAGAGVAEAVAEAAPAVPRPRRAWRPRLLPAQGRWRMKAPPCRRRNRRHRRAMHRPGKSRKTNPRPDSDSRPDGKAHSRAERGSRDSRWRPHPSRTPVRTRVRIQPRPVHQGNAADEAGAAGAGSPPAPAPPLARRVRSRMREPMTRLPSMVRRPSEMTQHPMCRPTPNRTADGGVAAPPGPRASPPPRRSRRKAPRRRRRGCRWRSRSRRAVQLAVCAVREAERVVKVAAVVASRSSSRPASRTN